MNAYFFTAAITISQVVEMPGRGGQIVTMPKIWESRSNGIAYADNADMAQSAFEKWVSPPPQGENPVQVEINRLLAAQFIDRLFTETGDVAIDWPKIREEVVATLQTIPADDFEQGYWADVNQFVPPGKTSVDVESLKHSLPEDIRSGMNWAADKKFFFIVCALSLPLSLGQPAVKSEAETPMEPETNPEDPAPTGEVSSELPPSEIADLLARESAALVVARNSIVAAWLWRKFAAETPLAANPIYIAPWCTVISAGDADNSPEDSAEPAEPPA